MTNFCHNVKIERECTNTCKSRDHMSQIISSITKRGVTDQQLASFMYHLCPNFSKNEDEFGRSAIHIAASCGRHELCLWLITAAGADPNKRDFESGYTPIHRCIYYGYINTAVKLIKMGGNMSVVDNEDLNILDLLSSEMSPQIEFSLNAPCQVYVWGTNSNYTLGTGTDNARKQPELLDQFKKQFVSIIQVKMDEMHSLFRSSCGNVWSCGVGHGGRLGTGSLKPSISPQLIKTHNEACIDISVALNHSLLLLSNGTVLSFGLNSHYQLGLSPYVEFSSSPRAVCSTNFSQTKALKGVCAGKYHSVFYNDDSIYTCGLNGGQLGHPTSPGSHFITIPTMAPINLNGRKIKHVASSTGAIAFSVSNGDIYILHQYLSRKIASKLLDVTKLSIFGGDLDTKCISESGSELKVAILNSRGAIILWQQNTQQTARCIFGLKREFSIVDVQLTQNEMFLISKKGEAFRGSLSQKEKIVSSDTRNTFHKFLEKSECYSVKLKRLPNVFRAVRVTADPKGNNFAIIQTHPKATLTDIPVMGTSELEKQLYNLLAEASEEDSLHDVTFKISGETFPAHRYILSINGNLLYNLSCKGDVVEIKDINPYIFHQLLIFLYTGRCTLLQEGPISQRLSCIADDPLKLMMDVCVRFKIVTLLKKLSLLRYQNGIISVKEGHHLEFCEPPKLRRSSSTELYDITIKGENESVIRAHKCVLVARLEYFHNMLLGGWSETTKNDSLKLPFPFKVLQDLIDFLYDEKVPSSVTPDDLDYTIRLLVISDQLFVNKLREACEMALTSSLTLRNAITILQLASVYNTPQLKVATMQFISINLGFFIESRLLESLDDNILKELSDYYRNYSGKDYRVITPFPNAPSDECIKECPPIPWPEEFILLDEPILPVTPKYQMKSKKRTPRKSASSLNETQEVTEIVVSNPVTILKEPELNSPPERHEMNSPPEREETIWQGSDFPSLDDNRLYYGTKQTSPRIGSDVPKVFPPRLSQKQRKKRLSESESVVSPDNSPPKPQIKAWANIPPINLQSNSEIRNNTCEVFAEENNFVNIIAHDREKRINWVKMKSKPFNLTQMEDKAIVELMVFYNAENEFDERITVQRLLPTNVDQPLWIKSQRKLFS